MTRLPMLKGCPLCGDKDEFNPSVSTSYKYAEPGTGNADLVKGGHYIECANCGCCGPVRATEAEAIERWNTRTDPEAAKLEMLREQLVRAVDLLERVSGQEFANVARVSREVLAEVQGDAALKGAAE